MNGHDTKAPKLILVAAIDDDFGIGRDGDLAWRIPADLKNFKQITDGGWLLMGRATWQSIGRALPGRQTIVMTNSLKDLPSDVFVAGDLQESLSIAVGQGADQIFVCGGEAIYRSTIENADEMIVTRVPGSHDCDRFFPRWSTANFEIIDSSVLTEGLICETWRCRSR